MIPPAPMLPDTSTTSTSPGWSMSMAVWCERRAPPFAFASAASASATSARTGISCSVSARPTIFLPGCRTCRPSTNWLGYPRPAIPRTSSADSPLTFSRIASGTFGLPSGKRSYGFWAVYFSICSRLQVKACACEGRERAGSRTTREARPTRRPERLDLGLAAGRPDRFDIITSIGGDSYANQVAPGLCSFRTYSSFISNPIPGRSGTVT